jgi:uncharacterized protein
VQIQYLEIVTKDVDGVCAAYALTSEVQFGEPDAGLGNARTAALVGGGLVGQFYDSGLLDKMIVC